eukprot:sb/3463925/
MGVIKSIRHNPSTKIVETLEIVFDGIEEPQLILRDRREIMVFVNGFFFRSQFPITISYAITIHKAQGLTLDTVLTDLGKKVFGAGQSYVCLSRVRTLNGLHLINFAPRKVKASVRALEQYAAMGCKKTYMPQAPPSRFKIGKPLPERVWYTNKAAIDKAKHTIQDTTVTTIQSTKPHNTIIGNKKNKKNKPIINNRISALERINNSVDKIENMARRTRDTQFHLEVMETSDLTDLYQAYIQPIVSGNHQFDSDEVQIVRQLNPDPANVQDGRSKWLSDDVIQRFMWSILDRHAHSNPGFTLYSMSACMDAFRLPFNTTGALIRNTPLRALTDSEYDNIIIPSFFNQAYAEARWSTITPVTGDRHQRVKADGDPMSRDIIALIGNPNGSHWVLIIIDNRPDKMKTIYFDSSPFNKRTMVARCRYYLKALQRFRQFLFSSLDVTLVSPEIDETTHMIEDGKSSRQTNYFDCGVFALANLELYLANKPADSLCQSKIPLIRAKILSILLEFNRARV